MNKALRGVHPVTPNQLQEGDMIYLTLADADCMMVSLNQSNYLGMRMARPGLSLMMQDRGKMLMLQKAKPSGFAPGKLPSQITVPTLITKDGKP